MILVRVFLFLAFLGALSLCLPISSPSAWKKLAPGFLTGEFLSTQGSSEAELTVVRISPDHYRLKLLSSSEIGTDPLPLAEWAEKYDLLAAVNAGMYQENHTTSTGYMKNFGHFNNPSINPLYGAFLAFNPKQENLPPVLIVDRQHSPDWREIISSYDSVVQNYRMISSKGKNLWPPSEKRFPVACIAIDEKGEILIIYSSSLLSVHELNEALLDLPFSIVSAMYVEGGTIAGLVFDKGTLSGEPEYRIMGNGRLTNLPNVLGIVPADE
ncbi:MAG: phosphodiester glycosidase family protein [Desulfovibrionales bacterium]